MCTEHGHRHADEQGFHKSVPCGVCETVKCQVNKRNSVIQSLNENYEQIVVVVSVKAAEDYVVCLFEGYGRFIQEIT